MNRLIVRELIVYLPARVGPALVAIAAIPILTRLLPQREYGDYLLGLGSLTLIGSLCVSWLVSVIVRFQAVNTVQSLARASRPLLVYALAAGVLMWMIVASLQGPPWNGVGYILAGFAWIISFAAFEYYAAWLRARSMPAAYSLALCWRSAGALILAVPMLLYGAKNGQVVLLAAAAAMLIALLFLPRTALGAHLDRDDSSGRSSDAHWRPLLRYGLPAAFSNLCITGLSIADRFVVKAYLGSEALAAYGASYDIAERTIFFLNAMLLLSSSVVSVQLFEQKGERKAVEYLSHLLRIYLLGAAAIVTTMAALAPQIVSLLLPAAYAEGASILPIVAISGMLVGIMHRYSIVLSFHKRTDTVMYCSALALVINIVACLILIPRMGLVGGAVSTALGYGSWLLLIRLAARRYHVPKFPWITLARVGLAALAAAVAMRAVAQPTVPYLILAASTGFTVYACVLVLSGEVALTELRAVMNVARAKLALRR